MEQRLDGNESASELTDRLLDIEERLTRSARTEAIYGDSGRACTDPMGCRPGAAYQPEPNRRAE